MNQDRERWDTRHREQSVYPLVPLPFLVGLDDRLPRSGRALDLAGGRGANAVWMAQRGLNVTVADISPVALDLVKVAATAAGVSIQTLERDLEQEPFPVGPWDLVVCVRFLWRPLFAAIPRQLAAGGMLVVVHPTKSNLRRHDRPGPHHLLDDGELPGLVRGLEVLSYEEGWTDEGSHEARLVARRTE